MILDQSSGAIQQLATTAGLNVWTWTGASEVVVAKLFKLIRAQSLVDGVVAAQGLVDGAIKGQSLVDGAVAAQAEPS